MADSQWFYAIGADQHGPVTLDWLGGLLRDGQLHAQSLVWTPGMTQWQPAGSVPELAGELSAARAAAAPPDFYAADLRPAVMEAAPADGSAPPVQLLDYGLGDTRYVPAAELRYATFGSRFVAFLIDSILLRLVAEAGVFLATAFSGNIGGDTVATAVALTTVVFGFLYFTLMESSPQQATLGKMALGLKVTTLRGKPISFGQAAGRYFGKWLSSLILGIGYLMILWTAKHQGLHDQMAGTVVIKKR